MPARARAKALSDDDLVQPFMLESSGIRGDMVRLGPVVDHVLTRHAYPDPLAALLGEMLVLAALLANVIKYKGIFSLQTKGDGAVSMMIADVTSNGHLRGYAGFDEDKLAAVLRKHGADAAELPGVPELLGKGHLAFTVDQGPHTERYQGIVELTGRTLADCLLHYFRQSEQIQTGLIAAADRTNGAWRAAGVILQSLPDEAEKKIPPSDEDAWRRAMILQASCTPGELLDPDLPINDLLYRLFHEEGVRVFRRRALKARCRCSRKRLEETLRAMPRERIEELRVDGKVIVTCEFCNRRYRFDDAALARLYAP